MTVKQFVLDTLEVGGEQSKLSRYCDIFLITLISLNVLAVVLGSVDSIKTKGHAFLYWFEVFSVAVFTVEYILRLWTCNLYEKFAAPVRGRVKYAFTPMALVDLLAILPFYLPVFPGMDLRLLRLLRLFRIFRLLKLARYFETLRKLGKVILAKKEELVMTFSVVIVLLVFSSALMYSFEHPVQPENFSSIPAAMWWAVATLTTVGYGDVYPVTPSGQLLGAFIAILGVGMVALPAGIISSGLMEEIQKGEATKTCPHCGGALEEEAGD